MTHGIDDKEIELVKRLRNCAALMGYENAPGMVTAVLEAATCIEDLVNRLDAIFQEHRWCGK